MFRIIVEDELTTSRCIQKSSLECLFLTCCWFLDVDDHSDVLNDVCQGFKVSTSLNLTVRSTQAITGGLTDKSVDLQVEQIQFLRETSDRDIWTLRLRDTSPTAEARIQCKLSVSSPCCRRESTRVHQWPLSTCRRCHITTNCSLVGNDKHSVTPRTRLRFGERAFRVAASKALNQLPNNVRSLRDTKSFKKKLKTFLFTKFNYV